MLFSAPIRAATASGRPLLRACLQSRARGEPITTPSRLLSISASRANPPPSDRSLHPQPAPSPSAHRADTTETVFVEPQFLEPEPQPASPEREASAPDVTTRPSGLPSSPTALPSTRKDRLRTDDDDSTPSQPLPFGARTIDDPTVLYKGPVERSELQVPLSLPPDHPFHFLPIRDKLRLDKDRQVKLPTFPQPVKIPAYPQPIFKPSVEDVEPMEVPQLRYRDLPPENLVEMYKERVLSRPKKTPDNGPIQRLTDSFLNAGTEEEKGWWLVREKMGLPPENAYRPASLLWYWEGLTEAQLWKVIKPLFWVWVAVPVLGMGSLFAFMVWDGYYIDPLDGSWKWFGNKWWANNVEIWQWKNVDFHNDLSKFDRPPVVKI